MVSSPAKFNPFEGIELWMLNLMIGLLSHSTFLRRFIRGTSDIFTGKQKIWLVVLIFASLLLGILSGFTISHVLPGLG